MKKICCMLLAMALLTALAGLGVCESLFVDNRETDKIYPERLNLRAEPSKNGGILGLYYTGAEVEVLGRENEDYTKVQIGGMTGYMASEYLITAEEAEARYGADSGFGTCRAAEVDLTGLWRSTIPLLASTDLQGDTLGTLSDGQAVELVGIIDDWAYVAAQADGQRLMGYIALDALTDVGAYKVVIVSGAKADSKTILYDAPNDRAKEVMVLKNGTACFNLFGRKEGNWCKVRVGGVTGWVKYTQAGNLAALTDASQRNTIPYYPLMMQTKTDALLYSVSGDLTQQYMTLGQNMKVEVLAEHDNYAYVRTYEGGAGAYDCGDFGYVSLSDLTLTQATSSVGVAQVDDDDLPSVLLDEPDADGKMIGALCSGAQVRIVDYTQTDYVQVALGSLTGYIRKSEIRLLGANESPSERIPQRATLREDAALLDGPSQGAQEEESVASGSRVYMLGVCGDYAFVQAGDSVGLDISGESADRTGFIPLAKLNAPASTTHLTAFVNTDKVNLRSEANSQTGAIIGRARTGERLRVADYGVKWTCVVTPDGKRGYIMTEYLEFE